MGQTRSSSEEVGITVGGTADLEVRVAEKGYVEMRISSELFEGLIMQPLVFQ